MIEMLTRFFSLREGIASTALDDGQTYVIWPLSTARPVSVRYWHHPTCPVQADQPCTCPDTSSPTRDEDDS